MVIPTLDEPSLEELVDVGESEILKESFTKVDEPLESCKLAVNENVPGAVGIPVNVPPAEFSERPGGRSPSDTLQE